jgi:hypothetical protein
MKTLYAVISIVVSFAAMPAAAEPGPGLYPHEDINRWGFWGKDDERGAANFIAPDKLAAASQLIRRGRTFSIAIPLDATGPVLAARRSSASRMWRTDSSLAAY